MYKWYLRQNFFLSTLSFKNKKISELSHIYRDTGTEFRSDTLRKRGRDNKIKFSFAAPKYQEQIACLSTIIVPYVGLQIQ